METDIDNLFRNIQKDAIYNNSELNQFKQYIDDQEYDTDSIINDVIYNNDKSLILSFANNINPNINHKHIIYQNVLKIYHQQSLYDDISPSSLYQSVTTLSHIPEITNNDNNHHDHELTDLDKLILSIKKYGDDYNENAIVLISIIVIITIINVFIQQQFKTMDINYYKCFVT